jgi:acyl-coenzyme A thioesterase PaaI-like protein
VTGEPLPPPGFAPHFRKSGLTDPWEPIFSRRTDDAVILGLWAGPAHVNSRGFVHGGLITALADNAMGLSCAVKLDGAPGLVTVSLAVDFLGVAKTGQWLAFETGFTRLGGTFCFAQCFVSADGAVCGRANATFRVLALRG